MIKIKIKLKVRSRSSLNCHSCHRITGDGNLATEIFTFCRFAWDVAGGLKFCDSLAFSTSYQDIFKDRRQTRQRSWKCAKSFFLIVWKCQIYIYVHLDLRDSWPEAWDFGFLALCQELELMIVELQFIYVSLSLSVVFFVCFCVNSHQCLKRVRLGWKYSCQ